MRAKLLWLLTLFLACRQQNSLCLITTLWNHSQIGPVEISTTELQRSESCQKNCNVMTITKSLYELPRLTNGWLGDSVRHVFVVADAIPCSKIQNKKHWLTSANYLLNHSGFNGSWSNLDTNSTNNNICRLAPEMLIFVWQHVFDW